jgi:DNA-directed RNA polymerase sigma subunit (sigma70/sigma32)
VLAALGEVIAALQESTQRNQTALGRARHMASARASGRPWREIVEGEERPLVVELMTESLDALLEAGSRLRRAKARALHEEGVTMEAIGQLFGVTRQRVSSLLRPTGDGASRPKRRGEASEPSQPSEPADAP